MGEPLSGPAVSPADSDGGAEELDPDQPEPYRIFARTASADQTMALAGAFAGALRAGDMILLAGDLGAGKTTFTKGLARALGVTEPVTSPTFTLVRSYETALDDDSPERASDVRRIVHADLFRLDHLRQVVDLAIGEMLEDDAVAVVEWGDRAAPVLGSDALVVSLAIGDDPEERSVTIRLPGNWRSRREDLGERLRRWL